MTHYLAWHLSPFSVERLSTSPQRGFPAPELARRTSIRINTSLKLRARNGKELFGSKIMNMENQMRPGQEASRSRCFKFRTPRGSVKLNLMNGREMHEHCDLECLRMGESGVQRVKISGYMVLCSITLPIKVTPRDTEKQKLCPEATF